MRFKIGKLEIIAWETRVGCNLGEESEMFGERIILLIHWIERWKSVRQQAESFTPLMDILPKVRGKCLQMHRRIPWKRHLKCTLKKFVQKRLHKRNSQIIKDVIILMGGTCYKAETIKDRVTKTIRYERYMARVSK